MIDLKMLTLGKLIAQLNWFQNLEDARRRKALARIIRLIKEEENE